MTMAPPEGPPATHQARRSGPVTLPPRGTGERALRRARRTRRNAAKAVWGAALVACIVAIPVLSYVGFRTVFESREGQAINPVTDDAAPGYEALVDATETMLVAGVGDDGVLNEVVVLALNSDGVGGAALFMPVDMFTAVYGPRQLAELYLSGGLDQLGVGVGAGLSIGLTEATEVTPQRWAELVAPLGSLTVDNPDDVVVADESGATRVVFPAGEIELAPDEVAAFMDVRDATSFDVDRLIRQELVWEAWLTTLGALGDPGLVPGEGDVGLARFVQGLASGPVVFETMPLVAGDPPLDDPLAEPQYTADEVGLADLLPRIIPLAAGGGRPRLRLLDGAGLGGVPQSMVELFGRAGAALTVIGNAGNFDYETTQIIYYDPREQVQAEAFLAALGAGEIVFSDSTHDVVDVTIILGADLGLPLSGGPTPGGLSE